MENENEKSYNCWYCKRERERERELYSKPINEEKGITLVALVVTIVVLLILAGITIVMLFGENGVINKAQNASVETKLGEIEDAAGLILTDLNMKKHTENPNIDTSMSAIVAELGNKGYKIKTVSGAGGGITGISLENNNITLKPGESIDLKVKFEGNTDGNEYYAVIEGKNYKITPKQGGISIAKEPVEISGTPIEEILSASSSDSKVTIAVPNTKGDIVKITAGSEEVESVTITINYGEEGKPAETGKSITCTVKVEKEPVIVSIDDIVNATDKSNIYGKTVSGYNCANSDAVANWKIFYAGNEFSTDGANRIYLIADDYIERTKIPKSTVAGGTGNKLNDGNSSYLKAAYFTNILGDYEGSASITDGRLKKLNNSYYSQNFTSTNKNMKSVAYMMDTNAWRMYKDTNKAEYAIGGPTVELLMKSYSQKHNVNYQAKAVSATGYQISNNGDSGWTTSIGSMLSTSDTLYILPLSNGAYGMWLASPSAYINDDVMYVSYEGSVCDGNYSNNGLAFRPLVCLNSNVQLEQLSDGNYQLK